MSFFENNHPNSLIKPNFIILISKFILLYTMKLIFWNTFLKKAKSYGITIDDLQQWITDHFHSFHLLCSPLEDTNAYKWYYSGVDRVIVFHVSKKWILYPVYIGDKNDPIAKNITVAIVKDHAQERLDKFLTDLQAKNCQIRHIKPKK